MTYGTRVQRSCFFYQEILDACGCVHPCKRAGCNNIWHVRSNSEVELDRTLIGLKENMKGDMTEVCFASLRLTTALTAFFTRKMKTCSYARR